MCSIPKSFHLSTLVVLLTLAAVTINAHTAFMRNRLLRDQHALASINAHNGWTRTVSQDARIGQRSTAQRLVVLDDITLTDDLVTAITNINNLTSLYIIRSQIPADLASPLQDAINGHRVRIINMSGSLVPPAFLAKLTCPTIWSAHLPNTAGSVNWACRHPCLAKLHLDAQDIDDVALARLAQLGALRELYLHSPRVGSTGFPISLPPNIDTLLISNACLSGVTLAQLPQCTKLRSLSLYKIRLDDRSFQYISKCHALSELVIVTPQTECVQPLDFSVFPDLRALQITHATLIDRDLLSLRKLPAQLTDLRLNDTQISARGLRHLLKIQPYLRHLAIMNCDLRDERCAIPFSATPLLEHIDLSGSDFTDNDLSDLARLPRLRTLHLDDVAITDQHLADILGALGPRLTPSGAYN